MAQRLFLKHVARHASRVAFARFKRGPSRPSWSYGYELFMTALRATSLEMSTQSYQEQRVASDSFSNRPSRVLERVVREKTTIAGIPCMWFTPREPATTEITILYLHGGGYVFGSMKTHGELIANIALATPARVIAPEYRLAPEHPFPAAIDDVVLVYKELTTSGGIDPKKLIVSGDSAGGGLTMALLQRLRDAGDPLPAGAALICPWSDLSAKGGSLTDNAAFDWGNEEVGQRWVEVYLGDHDRKDPLASPVFGNLRGLPPLLIQVGSAELLHDQASMLAERAKEHGVDTRFVVEPDQIHVWHTFAWLFAHCARAIDEIGAFARSVTT